MDKNMIKIDDLLRQRLGDAEEQERPGAWLHMRELLDKQMPVRGVPGAAFNWRRMFGYLGALVLLLAVSAGGYQVLQSFNTEAPLANNTGTSTAPTPATGLAGIAANTAMPQELQETAAAAPQPEMAAVNTTKAESAAPEQAQQKTANTSAATYKNNTGKQDNNYTNQPVTAHKDNTSAGTAVKNATKNNQQDIIPASGSNITSGTTAAQKGAANIPSEQQRDVEASLPYLASNSGGQQKTTNERNGLIAPNQQGGNNTTTGNSEPVAGNNMGVNKTTTGNKPTEPEHIEKEIPYNKIEIQERESKNGVVKKDTIFNGEDVMKVKMPKDKELLALNKKEEDNSGSNMNPGAAAPASGKESSEENAAMQKLGDHKVASKKMKNYNPHRFEEMVRNAKFRMGAMKFYPGIVGGINGTVNGNLGVHGGLAANLSVSDRWNILAEVKYAHRLNFANGKKIQDDYITNVKFNNINGQGVYTYDSMEHYYNFGSYASLEMPFMVTYSKDRWIYMLGANFRYNFKINNLQEVEQRYLLEQSLTSTTEPKFDTKKQILLSDFTPSMNIGPMLGVGYQVSPAYRLDLRVSNSLWNNANTFGQKEISKSLHNMPQVQFNLTHRFRSAKPYKRAQ